jgi:glycosyltransferase involved in cell wall biosynthesis
VKTLSVSGKFLSQPMTGVQRYADDIVTAWDQGLTEGWIDPASYSIRVIAPRTILQDPGYKHIRIEQGATDGRFFEQVELAWLARGTLLFSPYAAAPLLKGRHAVTIHDAAAAASPGQYSLSFRTYCAVVFRVLSYTCKPIFTVSEFSKKELHSYFSIPEEKMKVISPGCDHLLGVTADSGILERHGLEKNRFVLGVSSQSTVKNFQGLAKAWAELRRGGMKLAIAGRTHSSLFRGETVLDDGVVRLGHVSDGELRCLYENAALFAYPSFYEGFGIPPVEAMSCECPVLVARSSSLPEACGDAALYCDPGDTGDIARGIALLLDDGALADQLRQKGKARAAELTARHAASAIWAELLPYI